MVNNLRETTEIENTLEAPIYASIFPRFVPEFSIIFYNAEIHVHLQDKEWEQKSRRGLKSQPEKKVSFTLEAMTIKVDPCYSANEFWHGMQICRFQINKK